MSEKSKGDTSRIVNNPLLSASVTGLTFDDFPSAPLLLPAAPPIERSPPPVLDLNTDAKESATGQSLNADSDVFSEINLNATADEEEYSHQQGSTNFISPLEESPAVTDTSLLSQAASSFSQLPSVASTVFSTFSKVIKDYTPTSQENDDGVGVTGGGAISEPPAALATYDNFYSSERYDSNSSSNLSPPQADQPPPEPPKFYSPIEFTTQSPATNTSSGNQNTYRLSAKKKTYAHIPGLSSNSPNQPPAPIALAPTPPHPGPAPLHPFQPPQPYEQSIPPAIAEPSQPFLNSGPAFNLQSSAADIQPFVNTAPQAESFATKKEERRGLFSFSNVVAPVWQNLSGLVGKASSQERETVNSPSSGIDFEIIQEQQPTFGYGASPLTATQYFSNPTSQFESVAQPPAGSVFEPPPAYQQITLSQPITSPQHFGPPPPPVGSFTVGTQESAQPLPASALFDTSNSSAPAPPALFVPQTSATTPAVPLVNPYGTINAPLPPAVGFNAPPTVGILPESNSALLQGHLGPPPVSSFPVSTQESVQPLPASAFFDTSNSSTSALPQVSATPPAVPLVNPYGVINPPLPPTTGFNKPPSSQAPPTVATLPQSNLGPPPVNAFPVGTQESVQSLPASVFFDTSNSSASAPPAGFIPSVTQLSATPPAVPLVNPYGAINSPESNPVLPQGPPKASTGNTFRLQKGTRHYRAPLEIATNPAVSSNFLQSSNEHNLQTFTPFNPVATSQPQVYSPAQLQVASEPQPPISISSQPQQGSAVKPPHVPLPSQLQGPQIPLPLGTPALQSQALPESQLQGPQPTKALAQSPSGLQVTSTPPPPSQLQGSLASQLQGPPLPQQQAPTASSKQSVFPPPTQEQPSIALFNPQPLTFHQPPTEPTAPLLSAFGKVEQNSVNLPNAPSPQQPQLFYPFTLQTQPNSVTDQFSNTQPLQNFFTQQPAFNPFVSTPNDNLSGQNAFQAAIPQPSQEAPDFPISSLNTENQNVDSAFVPNTEVAVAPETSEEPVISKEEESDLSQIPPADIGLSAEVVEDIPAVSPLSQQLTSSEEQQCPAAAPTTFLSDAFGNLQLENKALELQPSIEPTEHIQTATQPFALTNYFASQTFDQTQLDLNANKPPGEPFVQPSRKSSSQSSYQPEPVNFFSQVYKVDDNRNATVPSLPDPISFFDSFQQESATSSTPLPPPSITGGDLEDELNSNFGPDTGSEAAENSFQIQNFFNNPPQNLNQSEAELNYKLVGSNLIKNRYVDTLSRAISPQSNVVEPPSSACSEFSTEASFQNTSNLSKLANVDDIPDYLKEYTENLDPEIMAQLVSAKATTASAVYQPAVKHWFCKKKVDDKYIWTPFSHRDSTLIEAHFNDPTVPKIVSVEGGRYDVNIDERQRIPIYWSGETTEVRRCSWFYKGVDSRYVPYEEVIADKLECEYEEAFSTGEWHRKIPLPTGEMVVFHGATVMVHFLQTQSSDSWGASQTISRSRVVKRDLEDFTIEPDESHKVDHLLFMVHGIGSVCDLKFRTVEEVVDEFRSIATQLVQSHYKNSTEAGRVGRVEILPISWHSELHSEESGIDEKLKAITLESMPKLRNFANDTLLDILFYTSPIFCQNIMDTVGGTMNKVYSKYCQRNPQFNGGVSLAGHSLGSLILFDLLCHQKPIENSFMQNSENPDQPITPIKIRAPDDEADVPIDQQQVNYTIGSAGTGQAFISYPQLVFQPKKFFALGSPIGMFVTIRGIDKLGLDFKLPTCPGFFNIFHPYDPVAYRIEALVNRDLSTARPVVVPHHKGRKRMHLELRETMTRVGADIKQKIVDAFKNTMDTVYHLTAKQKNAHDAKEIEKEVDKVLEEQLKLDKEPRSRTDSVSTQSDIDAGEIDLPLGNLNEGKRIDHVLQEAPLEFINEYLFALTSHVCYWESADTILFLMKEVYSSLGIQSDSQVPQQGMTIERPQSNSFSSSFDNPYVEQ